VILGSGHPVGDVVAAGDFVPVAVAGDGIAAHLDAAGGDYLIGEVGHGQEWLPLVSRRRNKC